MRNWSNKKLRIIWHKYANKYWWGDPLDVRFYLCEELSKAHSKKILDVGCNIGVILNSADDSNIKEGFDLNGETIKIAKRINKDFGFNANFYIKDVFKSDIAKNSFDILILSNVLPSFDYSGYDFNDCKRFIEKCSLYLKKGGILYLTSPNGNNFYYRKKHKITYDELHMLLAKNYNFDIKGWNPFPLQLGHILQYVPGWFSLSKFLMKNNFMKKHCVSFYVKAIKK